MVVVLPEPAFYWWAIRPRLEGEIYSDGGPRVFLEHSPTELKAQTDGILYDVS